MKTIGITGVMGAGKSSAIEILKEAKMTVLDCDRINDELLLPEHDGYCELVSHFGDQILNTMQEIDRKNMSNLIFSDPKRKLEAEAILHPLIKKEIIRQLKNHQHEAFVFVEVPLLYEIHWESFFDEVWVVASDEALLLERLMKYRNVCEAEAKRRLNTQMTQEEKVKKADVVLWNNSDKDHLKEQIYAILNIE